MRYQSLLAMCLTLGCTYAQPLKTSDTAALNDSITASYSKELDQLIQSRDEQLSDASHQASTVDFNPYYYRLMLPGTYYSQAVKKSMQIDWQPEGEYDTTHPMQQPTSSIATQDQVLSQLYTSHPQLVKRSEETADMMPVIREEIIEPTVPEAPVLAEKAVTVELEADVPDTIAFIPKKPKFWKFKGNASLQFTQNYFSENWYQGGEKNYAGIGMLTAEANYDNQRKLQWDNKLEAQLGFQTTTSDDFHKFRVTSNLLRLTSKLGYKAAKNWFYTGQVMSYTQLAPYYDKNQRDWKSNFATPLYLTISVGMDYKFKSKNEKVELSVYLSPVAYYMTSVSKIHSRHHKDDDPTKDFNYIYSTTHGLEHPEDHVLHKFGPNLTVNSKIVIVKNVTWTSRFYWFSNFHSTLFEWENTLDFTVNKYLSAKFYAYPRFDDSNHSYRKKHGYLMFKEWLSLGLSYNF